MLYSTRHANCGLAVHLMGEINEAKSLAYRAAIEGDEATVVSYDNAIARKLKQCANMGFPLHQARQVIANGRNLQDYSPNGWEYIAE